MRVPELERLLDAPLGALIGDQFESLRVRVAKAVERIEERAGATAERLHMNVYLLRLFLGFGVAASIGSVFCVLAGSGYLFAAVLLAMGLKMIRLFWNLRVELRSDIDKIAHLAQCFRADLEAAQTAEDLQKLGERIRKVMREAIGDL